MRARLGTNSVRRSWLVMAVLVGILAGLGLARQGWSMDQTLSGIILALSPLLLLRRRAALVIALALGLVIGSARGAAVHQEVLAYETFSYEKVTLIGKVSDDPAYEERGQLEFHITKPMIDGEELPGRVRVRGFVGALSIRRGDVVQAEGKLYPGFGSRQGSLSFAEIKLIRADTSQLENFRRRFFAGVYSALPEPQASLGLGFLVGTRSLLPAGLTDQLRRVGLTHIVAVSGYNLTILVRFARRFGAKFSKRTAALLAILLVTGFVAVAGTSPSIARATSVTALALGAWYYGRKASPIMLLLFSSALTAMVNPLYLWGDLGWWLSFLAFFGILIIAPMVRSRLFGEKKLHWLPAIMIETASAQLMTMPLIMAVFSELSVISLLANLIVLPLVPLAMLLTFISGIVGMLAPALAGWLAWPAQLVLTFITEITGILSRPNWAFVEAGLSTAAAGAIYGSALLAALILYQTLRRKRQPVFLESVIE